MRRSITAMNARSIAAFASRFGRPPPPTAATAVLAAADWNISPTSLRLGGMRVAEQLGRARTGVRGRPSGGLAATPAYAVALRRGTCGARHFVNPLQSGPRCAAVRGLSRRPKGHAPMSFPMCPVHTQTRVQPPCSPFCSSIPSPPPTHLSACARFLQTAPPAALSYSTRRHTCRGVGTGGRHDVTLCGLRSMPRPAALASGPRRQWRSWRSSLPGPSTGRPVPPPLPTPGGPRQSYPTSTSLNSTRSCTSALESRAPPAPCAPALRARPCAPC
mgnify:CR=1 FL=1